MAGRGDNNKHGSAGQGSGNQSNQPFVTTEDKHPKSDHNKKKTGSMPSEPSPRTGDQDAARNEHLKEGKQKENE
jgi:hypothetical protein